MRHETVYGSRFGLLARLSLGLALASLGSLAACVADSGVAGMTDPDLAGGGAAPPDMAAAREDAAAGPDLGLPPNECGSHEPSCAPRMFGVPFPLSTDPMPQAGVEESAIGRDSGGYLGLTARNVPKFDYLWLPASSNLGGTVSKMNSKTIREVARYPSVTCHSLKTGGLDPCDGTNGCCAVDDWPRYQARVNNQQQPGRQTVQTMNNHPSRTAVDLNGDLYVANQAFGGQASVTRIAANLADCVDRNRNGKIETSSDSNGNGFIDPPEYLGLDDECVLWTSNTFVRGTVGRALAGVPSASGATDVWAGGYGSRTLVRVDGQTGIQNAQVVLDSQECANSGPFTAAADDQGIVWLGSLGNDKLCWFDSRDRKSNGTVRHPQFGSLRAFQITIDREQNIWLSSSPSRYVPDRSNGTKNLGNGWWSRMGSLAGGVGIAVDSRSREFFVYACLQGSGVVQIPASKIAKPRADETIVNPGWPTIAMPCFTVGVDAAQNVWGISGQQATRALVDDNGKVTTPVVAPPKGNDICPAGDSCKTFSMSEPPGDFTGFNLRSGTPPSGRYSMIVHGMCPSPRKTRWAKIAWEADVPVGSTLSVRHRTGDTPVADLQWTPWTTAEESPASLMVTQEHLQVEFTFKSPTPGQTPKLRGFTVWSECVD